MSARAIAWGDRFFERFGVYAVVVGRLLPFVSFDLVSYGAGLTGMSFSAFIVATAVGMIPGTLLYAYLGRLGGDSGGALLWTLVALPALGLLALLVGRRFTRRLLAGPEDSEPGGQRRRGANQRVGGDC
jgi:uncharacterized membrane protein YdjX (TVP38/TMEM64 family)